MGDLWGDGRVGVKRYVEWSCVGIGGEMEHGLNGELGGGEDVPGRGQRRGENRREAISDVVVCADFADAFTLERVIAEHFRACAASAIPRRSVG